MLSNPTKIRRDVNIKYKRNNISGKFHNFLYEINIIGRVNTKKNISFITIQNIGKIQVLLFVSERLIWVKLKLPNIKKCSSISNIETDKEYFTKNNIYAGLINPPKIESLWIEYLNIVIAWSKIIILCNWYSTNLAKILNFIQEAGDYLLRLATIFSPQMHAHLT